MATIRKRKRKLKGCVATYWVVDFSVLVNGCARRRQEHFRVDPKDPSRARLLAEHRKAEIERNVARTKLLKGSLADEEPRDVEIADWLDYFAKAIRPNCSDRYHQIIVYTLQKFRDLLKERDILTTQQLNRQHFSDFVAAMKKKGNSPKSTHNDLSVIKRAVAWGIDEGWFGPNILRSFPKVKVPKKKRRALSKEEIQKLLKAAEGTGLYEPILVALYTGARRGELVQLLCSDVDLKWGIVHFRGEITKAGEDGDIPIHASLKPLLERRAKEGGHLVELNGEPWPADQITRQFTVLAKEKLGWPDVTFHCLRHTFGTQLAASGKISPFDLQKLMRHKSITTSMIYVNLAKHDLPSIDVF